MNKLIELLNEYEKQDTWYINNEWEVVYWWGDYWNYELEIISKKYWFIKRLVDNDKIYLDNEDLVSLMSDLRERRHPVKCLLMLLSIQDNPIEFLISILR